MDTIIQILFTTIKHLIERITQLEEQIKELNLKVNELLTFIVQSISFRNWRHEDLHSPKYQKFKTDELPIIQKFEKIDYIFFIAYIKHKYCFEIKPIKRRGGHSVPEDQICPKCGAPHDYIYRNNGSKGQFLCKICNTNFHKENRVTKPIHMLCPHCGTSLEKIKKRKDFYIHKCRNLKCSYYLKNKRALPKDISHADKSKYKLHYIFREFFVDFFKMDIKSLPNGATSLKFKKNNPHIMGLCLTYNINLQLSLRKTALALKEIHGIDISHTMVANYTKTAAAVIKPLVDQYDYNPTDQMAADETYIKVRGVKHYIWLIMDAVSRSIIGYQVSDTRSVGPCILTMRMALDKFKKLPENLTFVADGYSAYPLAAQQFLRAINYSFTITQVIGLTNDDPVSKEFRPFKQRIERVNRTLKENYRHMCGFNSFDGAQHALTLWVAYYNFLRPHSISGRPRVLNAIDILDNADNMPGKWQLLIFLGQQTILNGAP